jgi:NAD(P)-dependent dehydrogenase (short-subunit alcohol dehydrogenase family)
MANHEEFGAETEASTVAEAFSSQIANKVILITGVNAGGIGGSTTEALAAHSPKLLILSGRSQNKVEEVIAKVKLLHPDVNCRYLHLDLSSQRSVRAAAKEVLSYSDVPQIDILINNAGVMNIPDRTVSEDGIEMQFATNHIGHFLFTNLIVSKLIGSSKGSAKGAKRIVNVSSRGVRFSPVRFSDLNFTKAVDQLPESERPDLGTMKAFFYEIDMTGAYHGMVAYGQSKTANVLFSLSLTERLYSQHGIMSFGVHPGAILTELSRHSDPAATTEAALDRYRSMGMVFKTLAAGAATTLVAALDPKLPPADKGGKGVYMEDCQIAETKSWATDPVAAEKLWNVSEELVGEKFLSK